MVFLGFSPYFIFSSFFTTLLLDRGIHVTGNKQYPISGPWNPSSSSSLGPAKSSNEESEALKRVLPLVTFDCRGKTGYFPDSKFNCEVFHYCQPNGARNTFHCPTRQLFNQLSMVCEENTIHNSKLCREGSINPAKILKNSASKKHDASQKNGQIFKPSPKEGDSGDVAKKIMTLEDLLSYMNSGHLGTESEPTFVSRFHNADDSKRLKMPSDSASTTPHPENKSTKKASKSMDTSLTAQGSDPSFGVTKSPPVFGDNLKKKAEEEDVSIEYDAIEGGRKFRKHKRMGQVLDVPADQQPKKEKENQAHMHMSVRSATDAPLEDSTLPPSSESKNPSLFSTDRNKARDFRKRKRYQGRKRKIQTPGAGNETEQDLGSATTTATPISQTIGQDVATVRSNAYRRRKSQRPRLRDDASQKIEPYTLPPLPVPDEETTTESMPREEKKKDSLKDGRSKHPWHKPAPSVTGDGVQYGEKLADLDQHHYQTEAKMMEGPAPPSDSYGTKDMLKTSEEMLGEEYREGPALYSKHLEDPRSNHRPNIENFKKYDEEESYKYGSHLHKHHYTLPENLFPPPRAEAREHHSTTPQQMISPHESGSETSKSHNSLKATTEDPFRVTHPYLDKYPTAVKEFKDIEEQRWKTDSEKSREKKVEVGATFFFKDPVTLSTTKAPRLQVPPTTEAPVTSSVSKERDISKHTLAHQHLSKIMNDFFAMSSSNNPSNVHLDTNKGEEDLITPEYRIPDEDIYTGSESATDDVEEIPPELLEVVDFITGHTGSEKSDLKPHASHEIIKIDGPITESHIERIFMDKFGEEESNRQQPADRSYKKIVVVPQPSEDKESSDSEDDELTSLKLEPLLKQISGEKSVRVIPLRAESIAKRQPTMLTAKKIPVRIIYRDQLTEAVRSKLANRKPGVFQTHSTSPRVKFISSRGQSNQRSIPSPISHSFTHARTSVVIHPPSLFPPHPPPLPTKQIPFKIGYPFVINSRSHRQNTQIHRRRKRSIINRLRRQIRQNQHFLPFSSPVYPAFNPKFVPTFSPFKALFSPSSLHTSGTHLNQFVFPGYHLAKPSQNRPNIFQPPHQRPPPVRHVTQNGHPAVIVEEVPVPIHVEVPNPNLIRPIPSGTHPSKLNARYPGNQFRAPSPPAIQTPPLIQRPQNRFPPPPPPSHSSHYRPMGMPANARPPPPPLINYRSPIPFTGPLPPSITSDGQVYALGVTNKPIIPEKPRSARPSNGGPKPPRNPPHPYNHFSVHASAYPNFPYFQGAFTTPISHEPVVGRLMFSGYKPPKSTLGTKPPKTSTRPNKDRNASESKSSRSRSKSTPDYFEAPAKPMRESHVSYTEEVVSRGRSRHKPNLDDYSVDHTDLKPPKQSISKNSGSSDESVPRKRRPGRRRRPRPHSTTQGTPILNDISPTPPPPEQIPPPPADYTSKPPNLGTLSSLPSYSAGTKVPETNSHFPPAGYYGKDQLVQFFDSSSKSYQKTTSPKPYHPRDLGESRSSAELDESVTSISGEDGNEPAFGTRLRSKPNSQSRNRQLKSNQPARSQTQTAEVRTRPNHRPDDRAEQNKKEFTRPNENSQPVRNDRPPPRRRRPPPPRQRSRPPPMSAPQPEVHHFKYNENPGGFYSVPRGLQNLVAPSAHSQQGFRGSTDMFGIPHPVIDPSIYSLRPQGAPDFDPNFFSVPSHVAQQQQSPLRSINIKPVPESSRDFFTAPEGGSTTVPEPEKKESEQRIPPEKSGGENNGQREHPVRKLRKPKRKNRYNPHSSEQRDSTEATSVKPYTEQMTTRDSSTVRYREKSATVATTTPEPRSTETNYHSQNDIRENQAVYKQRNPLLPKTLPEISKSLLNGKIDIQKLNATISTSVSVSGAVPQTNNTSSEEKENKRVFSSQNGGGLAVVRKGPKRKRARQRVSTTTGVPYVNNNESSSDAKYEIAASVLDIIKATTETERQASGYYGNYFDSNKSEKPSSSRVSNTWVESPSSKKQASTSG